MHRHDEVQAGEDRTASQQEGPENDADHGGGGLHAVGRIEGPARVDRPQHQRGQREEHAEDVEVVARQIQPREGNVLGPQHDRQHEISQGPRNAGDEHEEDHDRAVDGEDLVVGFVNQRVGRDRGLVEQQSAGREQLRADEHGEHAAQEKRREDRDQVHHADPLVVQRENPGEDAAAVRQVVVAGCEALAAFKIIGDHFPCSSLSSAGPKTFDLSTGGSAGRSAKRSIAEGLSVACGFPAGLSFEVPPRRQCAASHSPRRRGHRLVVFRVTQALDVLDQRLEFLLLVRRSAQARLLGRHHVLKALNDLGLRMEDRLARGSRPISRRRRLRPECSRARRTWKTPRRACTGPSRSGPSPRLR